MLAKIKLGLLRRYYTNIYNIDEFDTHSNGP